MGKPFVSYKGVRKDGTVLYIHSNYSDKWNPEWPVYVTVWTPKTQKESQAYYYEEDAMAAVNKAWPDVKWQKINQVQFVKDVILSGRTFRNDYAGSIVAGFFEETFDLEEADGGLNFAIRGKQYLLVFGHNNMDEKLTDSYDLPDKYDNWYFYDENNNELASFIWET